MHTLSLLFSVFECQAPPIGWNMNYSVFGRFQWICLDATILEMMPDKTEEKKIVCFRVDGPLASVTAVSICRAIVKALLSVSSTSSSKHSLMRVEFVFSMI